jgi:hypothetical protein
MARRMRELTLAVLRFSNLDAIQPDLGFRTAGFAADIDGEGAFSVSRTGEVMTDDNHAPA